MVSATLETALPTTRSVGSVMAPEELFRPLASDLKDRGELTPAEKKSLRSKERRVRKRTQDKLDAATENAGRPRKRLKSFSERESKEAALRSVVKSNRGVTVVGTKLSSLDGKMKSHLVDIRAKSGNLKL